MKKNFTLTALVLIFASFNGFAQVITGHITNAETKQLTGLQNDSIKNDREESLKKAEGIRLYMTPPVDISVANPNEQDTKDTSKQPASLPKNN